MNIDLQHDWPVYLLLVVTVFFFVYAIINGNQGQKNKKDEQSHEKGSK